MLMRYSDAAALDQHGLRQRQWHAGEVLALQHLIRTGCPR